MGIKQELRVFYANQGLTGKQLRKAMQYDLRSIRKQSTKYHSRDKLTRALDWASSVEGTGYWVSRALGHACSSYAGRVPHPLRTLR